MTSSPVAGRSSLEELGNAITHGVGALVAAVATVAMTVAALGQGDLTRTLSFALYGMSLVFVLTSSTLYHSSRTPRYRRLLLVMDYLSIYTLIAGSYTPFALVVLGGPMGWGLFAWLWLLAAVGITARLTLNAPSQLLGTGLYVVMGWSGIAVAGPLVRALPWEALAWLLAGGVTYTVGAVFYLWERLPYNHLIWHLAVLAGAACHFICVWRFVA